MLSPSSRVCSSNGVTRLLAWALVVVGLGVAASPRLAHAHACANTGLPGTPYEGFGAATPGGAGKPVYRVTTLADSGPGSLRDALAAGNRCVVFDVAGTITLQRQLYTRGAFVTVDGFSAPAPGITVRDYGISLWGNQGVHDVIVRGLRFRNAGQKSCPAGECWDGIQIKSGAQRIVVDHVSSDNASDGAIDITDSSDITVQWSVISGTRNQSLIERAVRVTLHHNLFIGGQNRNPQVQWDDTLTTPPPDTVLDFRNNVLCNYTAYGVTVRSRATANVADNYYYSASRPTAAQALIVDHQGRAHAGGNLSGSGANVDARGTESTGFPAAPVTTSDACRAAYEVQDEAGARGVAFGPDSVDANHLGRMPATELPGCPALAWTPATVATDTVPARELLTAVSSPGPAPVPPAAPEVVMTSLAVPATITGGVQFPITFGLTNRGARAVSRGKVRIYLAAADRPSPGDVLVRERSVGPIAPGATQSHGLSQVIPTAVPGGAYFLVLVTDVEGAVSSAGVTAVGVTLARPGSPTPATKSAAAPELVATGVRIPSVLQRGASFPVFFTVANQGRAAAAGSRAKIYLSADAAVSATDLLLRSRAVSALAPGASQPHALSEVIPAGVAPGTYYVLLMVDADGAVSERDERDNVTAFRVTVR